MRLDISFTRTSRQRMLPMDYQYYISAWVYKVLKLADVDFATFLHNEGYGASHSKLYKLFCFSRLNIGKPKLWKEHKLFEISTEKLSLMLSFDVNDAAATFIKGLFIEQEFFLGSKFNGLDLKVTGVEVLPDPCFETTMHYCLQSPWVVSYQPDKNKNPRYLSPEDPLFKELAVKHIVEKYKNTRQTSLELADVRLVLHPPYKRAGFVMKPDTAQQTRIIGNRFNFELIAPVPVHQMIWNSGISEKSSSGFGWVAIR